MARRRRPLAALFAGLSVLLALAALRPAPTASVASGRTRSVLVAAHDLTAGQVLGDGDVRTASYPVALVPDGAVSAGDSPTGRRLVLPVRAGEPLTDVRFLADGLLERLSGPDSVAAPVRIADSGEVALVRPGNRVDVLAAQASDASSSQPGSGAGSRARAITIAAGAVVLSVPTAAAATITDGGLVVLAVPAQTARALAGAASADRLSLVLRP
jgi:Flp pilus assembly protein CpaB